MLLQLHHWEKITNFPLLGKYNKFYRKILIGYIPLREFDIKIVKTARFINDT